MQTVMMELDIANAMITLGLKARASRVDLLARFCAYAMVVNSTAAANTSTAPQ